MEAAGRIIRELCDTHQPRLTSDDLARELSSAGIRISSSYIRGVMTGKNLASFRFLEGCEKVFNLRRGVLTRLAVGYWAESLALKHGVSIEEVSRLLGEYLSGEEYLAAYLGPAPDTEGELGMGKAGAEAERVTHKRTIRSIMSTVGRRLAHFCCPELCGSVSHPATLSWGVS